MRYAIVISVGPPNCSAYSPDVDGCIATGQTVEETRERMQEALALSGVMAGRREGPGRRGAR